MTPKKTTSLLESSLHSMHTELLSHGCIFYKLAYTNRWSRSRDRRSLRSMLGFVPCYSFLLRFSHSTDVCAHERCVGCGAALEGGMRARQAWRELKKITAGSGRVGYQVLRMTTAVKNRLPGTTAVTAHKPIIIVVRDDTRTRSHVAPSYAYKGGARQSALCDRGWRYCGENN